MRRGTASSGELPLFVRPVGSAGEAGSPPASTTRNASSMSAPISSACATELSRRGKLAVWLAEKSVAFALSVQYMCSLMPMRL